MNRPASPTVLACLGLFLNMSNFLNSSPPIYRRVTDHFDTTTDSVSNRLSPHVGHKKNLGPLKFLDFGYR